MKNTNTNIVGNFVNPEGENEMNKNIDNNNASNSVNKLWEETEMENELSLEELISQVMGEESLEEETTMDQSLEEEIRNMAIKSFEESITLAEQSGVADDKILKNKEDIDNYFMPVGSDTKVNYEEEMIMESERLEVEKGDIDRCFGVDTKANPEEENKMNKNVNVNNATKTKADPEEEITVKPKSNLEKLKDAVVDKVSEVYHEENNPKAYGLVDKANSIISSDLNLEAYKEAVITLTEIEVALKETKSYTVKLSLADVQSRLTNLTNYYEDNVKASSTGSYEEKRLSGRESFVQGFVDLKDVGVEIASKAKASIDNIDEDNEYYQKGVEVTKKAKKKYNEVLGSVFNRLKL